MKWFLMVLLTQTQGDLHEGFLWYNPVFVTKDECIAWVNNNPIKIFTTLSYYYPNWEIKDTLCIREDKLQDTNVQPYPDGKRI